MRCSFVLQLALVASAALGKPFETAHESLDQRWRRISKPVADHPIELHISLRSPQQGAIKAHLQKISDPANQRWRQHLGPEDVKKFLQPGEGSVSAVNEWLASIGLVGRLSHHAVIVETSVDRAERLLNATYAVYENAAGRRVLRTEEYYVPSELCSHVEMVAPTVQFPHDDFPAELRRRVPDTIGAVNRRAVTTAPSNATLEAACGPEKNVSAGPDCVKLIYSIDWTASQANTSFAIFDPDQLTVNNTDIRTYLEGFGKDAANVSVTEVLRPGWEVEASDRISTEAQWDIEISAGLAWPVVPLLLRTDAIGFEGDYGAIYNDSQYAEGQDYFLKFLHEMAYNETVPPVVSISAGANEDWTPYSFAQRACGLIAASSARGVTWIVSSGDTGPNNPSIRHNTTIDPQWPASCPWVLSVGATADPYNESAATYVNSNIFTGGGFSNYFARPSYQNAAVPRYINQSVTPAFAAQSGFNASGRGYPDVAAIGAEVPIFLNGQWSRYYGTSASAPIWAAIITLLNDYEASRGRPTLGFVNPWLYSLAPGEGLRDIVSCNGSFLEPSHGQTQPAPTTGYNGSVGWDACTGLGVPMFDVLRASL